MPPEENRIQHTFEQTHPTYGVFRDAIVLPESEFRRLTPPQLTALKKQRFEAWVAAIESPQPDPDPVDEPTAIDIAIQAISESKDALDAALATLIQTRELQGE